MNTREKAQDWLVVARTTRGLLAPKRTPIEIITALLAERQALAGVLNELIGQIEQGHLCHGMEKVLA